MERLIQVKAFIDRKGEHPEINLTGDELIKYGFEIGDFVKVELKQNQIIITKSEQSQVLKAMSEKNPDLIKLIDSFSLTA